MPFTLAHPAIVLPLVKSKRFSATALVTGAMAPDFEYFLQLREVENIGHHWQGILLFDMPAALLLCYLFHGLLRNLLIAHLPPALQSRFAFVANFNWAGYAAGNRVKVVSSALIGIASHLLWDGFTHYDGLFVEMLPMLSEKTAWQGLAFPVYFLLQLFFSGMGVTIMAYTVYRLPQTNIIPSNNTSKYYWLLLTGTVGFIFTVRLTVWPQHNSIGGLAIAAMGSILYGWLAVSAFYYRSLKKISL